MPEPKASDGVITLNPRYRGVLGKAILVCGAITAGIGALVLVGWAVGSDVVMAMGTGYYPMAPHAALLFGLLGSALLMREGWPTSRAVHRVGVVASVSSVIVGSMTLMSFVVGLNISDWLFRTTRMFGEVPIGRMALPTALCFVLAGVALLLLERQARRWAGIVGALISLVGALGVIGYWFGAPFLYGGTVIPVTLPATLALVALGSALIAAAGPDTFPLNILMGPSTRARLLRVLLPTLVLLELIRDGILAILLEHSDPAVVLVSAMTAIYFLLMVSYAVTRVAGAIGEKIDRINAERNRAEEALRGSTKNLQELSRLLMNVEEKQRQFLARELHDELGQSLTALKVHLQMLEAYCAQGEAEIHLNEALMITKRALEQIHGMMLDLRPMGLEELGLGVVLQEHVAKQAETAGWHSHFEYALPGRLHSELETACFRVAQEALTNAMRHAEAKQVWVALWLSSGEVQLSVRDDGKGFNSAVVPDPVLGPGFGLIGMRERVRQRGGWLAIHSAPGRGTQVSASFPYEPSSGGEADANAESHA